MKRSFLTLVLLALVAAVALGAAPGSNAAPRIKPGQHVVFKPGVLKVGTPVVCTSHGRRVVVRVPSRGHSMVRISDWAGGGSTTLWLTTRANGSVVADCQ